MIFQGSIYMENRFAFLSSTQRACGHRPGQECMTNFCLTAFLTPSMSSEDSTCTEKGLPSASKSGVTIRNQYFVFVMMMVLYNNDVGDVGGDKQLTPELTFRAGFFLIPATAQRQVMTASCRTRTFTRSPLVIWLCMSHLSLSYHTSHHSCL